MMLLLAATLALAGCGKKGPPTRPGPADQILYPHQYPAPETAPTNAERPENSSPLPLSTLPGSTMPGTGIMGTGMPGSTPQYQPFPGISN